MDLSQIQLLEELAENAWPPAMVQMVDGWRVRYTWSISRRVDSVSANSSRAAIALGDKLRVVESFYARRKAPARFHLSPASQPEGLDAALAERGYSYCAATSVQTTRADSVLAALAPVKTYTTSISDSVTDAWFEVYAQSGHWGTAELGQRRGIMERTGPQQAYVIASSGETPYAVGRGVLERDWLGIFCMGTRPEFRGRGAGTAILRALAAWGGDAGVNNIYLQVMADNAPAVALYQRAGFHTQYAYHYREKMSG